MDAKALIKDYKAGRRNFKNLDLRGINLSWEELSDIDFQGSDIDKARFSGATLVKANFSGSNLKHSDFSGVNLSQANLCGADLRGVNLCDTIWRGTDYNKDTKFPIGFKPRDVDDYEQVAPQEIKPSPVIPSPKQVLELKIPNAKSLELVEIPAGSFMMGSNENENERPIHKVNLKAFRMGKYPVTQGQYEAVMGQNPSYFKGIDLPVEQVSWRDAVEFCQKLSQTTGRRVSLPSEAQWEYACRAGSTGKYCFGDEASRLGAYAWFQANSGSQTHPVGQKKPNGWGVYDMHGNVWEWCADAWHENYIGAPTDETVWDSTEKKSVQSFTWRFLVL
jgi:formylglycine-generating enzyme required for sulfatase activity